jgi:hypothetical protein
MMGMAVATVGSTCVIIEEGPDVYDEGPGVNDENMSEEEADILEDSNR